MAHLQFVLADSSLRPVGKDWLPGALPQTGLVVVEGFNDVLALDAFGQPSVGAMSNRLTEDQVTKIIRFFARQVSGHKITLMFDRNDGGREGQKEAMAKISEHVAVIDGWSGYGGIATEPEQLQPDEWGRQQQIIARRWWLVGTTNG